MGIPQIILCVLVTLNLGVALAKDGELRKETYSFFNSLFGAAIIFTLLIWGGFFK
jgi:hypothetical protein